MEDNFDDAYFLRGGAGYPDYIADGDILYDRGCRYARILARYMTPGRVLDVGAAGGFILRGLIDSGWLGRGIEPNRRMVEFGREHMGLEVDCGNLENYRGSETFDLIAMLQSIMHFFDVRRACEVAARVTKPGGYWLIEAFNPHSWIGRLLGKHWHDYNPPTVTPLVLPACLASASARVRTGADRARARSQSRFRGARQVGPPNEARRRSFGSCDVAISSPGA